MTILKGILAVTGITAAILIILFAGEKAFEGQEQFECNQWQQQAKEYKGFYLTGWQAAQCNHYQIKIDAPVQ